MMEARYSKDEIMQSRIMYIERKTDGLCGPARIGRVQFSRSGKSLCYRGRTLQTLAGQGFKANYFDVVTGEQFWVSGCKKRGGDSLYGNVITIDEDVREEYWTTIRGRPSLKECSSYKGTGKYR